MRVALVNMPFAAADRPSLAIGLLQAALRQNGFECVSKHYNLLFSRLLGAEVYRHLSDYSYSVLLAGDWVFSQVYYGQALSDWNAFEGQILAHPVWGLPAPERAHVRNAACAAPQFLRLAFESCPWPQFDVVGFTSTFEQTMAAVCLAQMIKSAAPRIKIVMGGANFEGSMGPAYLDLFPVIDYICVGEGEAAIVNLCKALAAGSNAAPAGMVSRRQRDLRLLDAASNLDDLPYPDFDDFVAASRRSGRRYLSIPLELSRGCWWGEKSHCTFCGLNGRMMRYRQKTPSRVIAEVAYLENRYQPDLMHFADNILSRDHSRSVLPVWAASPRKTPKFLETKANISRDELSLLGQGGVTIVQPGIESFSDTTLRVMGKGVLAAHNVALLRWGRELGVSMQYNIIFGFPKEALADYESMLSLVQELAHLDPPAACSPIRMDRFSPNHSRYRVEGFTSVRPMPAYRHVYAANDATIEQLAYYFDYEHPHSDRLLTLGAGLIEFVTCWQVKHRSGRAGSFFIEPCGSNRWRVSDTRFNRLGMDGTLDREEVALAVAADRPIGSERLIRCASALGTPRDVAAAVLEKLRSLGIIRRVGERWVTVALLADGVRGSFSEVSGEKGEVIWAVKPSSYSRSTGTDSS